VLPLAKTVGGYEDDQLAAGSEMLFELRLPRLAAGEAGLTRGRDTAVAAQGGGPQRFP
jgi:hypothetical protein